MTPVETIALILIVAAAIKIVVLLVNPKAWMNFAKRIYSNSRLVKVVAFILAAIVLYYLNAEGITIVQILAVAVFISLLLVIGLASEFDDLLKKYQARIKRGTLWRDFWFYTLIWIVLLVWGAKELFM